MHELWILDAAERQSNARIKKGCVDAIGIHVGDASVRVEAALTALIVRHCIVADDAVTCSNRAKRAEPSAPAKRLAVDAQTFLAVLVDEQARRPVTERGIDVVLPQIERLED